MRVSLHHLDPLDLLARLEPLAHVDRSEVLLLYVQCTQILTGSDYMNANVVTSKYISSLLMIIRLLSTLYGPLQTHERGFWFGLREMGFILLTPPSNLKSYIFTWQFENGFKMQSGLFLKAMSYWQVTTFSTVESMMQKTAREAEGMLAYVISTGSLFLKVSKGWKEIQVRAFPFLKINRQRLC